MGLFNFLTKTNTCPKNISVDRVAQLRQKYSVPSMEWIQTKPKETK
jgi:hypothetical protein